MIGDETGSGHELLHADDDGDGKPGSARKKLAYIWLLVPPGVELPATPSDFHAMDQKNFKIDHLEALENLEKKDITEVKSMAKPPTPVMIVGY